MLTTNITANQLVSNVCLDRTEIKEASDCVLMSQIIDSIPRKVGHAGHQMLNEFDLEVCLQSRGSKHLLPIRYSDYCAIYVGMGKPIVSKKAVGDKYSTTPSFISLKQSISSGQWVDNSITLLQRHGGIKN